MSGINTITIEGSTPALTGSAGIGALLPLTVINAYSAMTIPAYRRAMTFLSDNLTSFPRSVRKNRVKLDQPHPLDGLLQRRPNGLQNAFTFWHTLFFHAAHAGNGYARIDRDSTTFAPAALNNMLPEDVVPVRIDRGDGRGMQQWYGHMPTKTVLPAVDVIHFQMLSHDGMSAMDPIALHAATLQGAATIHRYTLQFLIKGTFIRGAAEVPGDLSDEQMANFRAILRSFRGPDGEDDVLILTNGGKLSNVTLSPKDTELLGQTSAMTKQIAQITGVPPSFLFELSEEKYRATVEQDGTNVVRFTFVPWITMAEAELSLKLLTDAEQDQGLTVHINPEEMQRGDTATLNASATSTVAGGIRTPNEGRDLLGLPKNDDPDSDKLKRSGDTTPRPPTELPKPGA